MRLRTTAGAYAGEIRDYPFSVAQAALNAGSAEPVDEREAIAHRKALKKRARDEKARERQNTAK